MPLKLKIKKDQKFIINGCELLVIGGNAQIIVLTPNSEVRRIHMVSAEIPAEGMNPK